MTRMTAEEAHYEKRMDEIAALKAKFVDLASDMRAVYLGSQFDYEDAVIGMEESFDDIFYKEFMRAKSITGRIEDYPITRFMRQWNEQQKANRSLRITTNPQTYTDIGEAI